MRKPVILTNELEEHIWRFFLLYESRRLVGWGGRILPKVGGVHDAVGRFLIDDLEVMLARRPVRLRKGMGGKVDTWMYNQRHPDIGTLRKLSKPHVVMRIQTQLIRCIDAGEL